MIIDTLDRKGKRYAFICPCFCFCFYIERHGRCSSARADRESMESHGFPGESYIPTAERWDASEGTGECIMERRSDGKKEKRKK